MAGRKSLFSDSGGSGSRPSRSGQDDDLDLTPMIDVTFLLLIFFMITSTMQGTPDLDVPPAKYGVGIPSKGAMVVTIRAGESEGERATIILGDGKGPEGTIDELRDYVEKEMAKNKTEVIIKADRDVNFGLVEEVRKAVAEVANDIEGLKYSFGVRDERS